MCEYRSFLNMFNHLKASRVLCPKTGSRLRGCFRAWIPVVVLLALGSTGYSQQIIVQYGSKLQDTTISLFTNKLKIGYDSNTDGLLAIGYFNDGFDVVTQAGTVVNTVTLSSFLGNFHVLNSKSFAEATAPGSLPASSSSMPEQGVGKRAHVLLLGGVTDYANAASATEVGLFTHSVLPTIPPGNQLTPTDFNFQTITFDTVLLGTKYLGETLTGVFAGFTCNLYASQVVVPIVPNAAPTDLALDNATIAENGLADAVVGSLTLADPDGSADPVIITEGVGEKIWEFATGAPVESSSPSIGSDGIVYVGSDFAMLYAINGQTGVKLWEFAAVDMVFSSPAIGSDGTVYFGGSVDKKVYALNGQTGVKKWEFETGGEVHSSPAIGSDGTVYVGSHDNKVYALNGQTGVKKWEFETGTIVKSSPAIGADGTVYVGSSDKKVYALDDQTGVKKWEFETGGEVHSSPAIGSDGTVYVGSVDSKVYALNGQTGVKKWEFETETAVVSSPAIGSDGTVYVGSEDNKVYALNGNNGAKLWEFETGSPVWSSPAIGFDGTVYVGSWNNKLYAINGQSGVKLWEFETGGRVDSSPAIGSDGTVYFGSFDTKLYAIQGSSGPADSPWPMRGQNSLHTGRQMPPPQPTFTLVAGAGDTDNAAFTIDGNELKLTAPADFEAKETYSLRIEGTDPGGLSFAKALTVTVTDVSENATPVFTSADAVDVAENQAAVSTVVATDADEGDTLTYTLTGGADAALFELKQGKVPGAEPVQRIVATAPYPGFDDTNNLIFKRLHQNSSGNGPSPPIEIYLSTMAEPGSPEGLTVDGRSISSLVQGINDLLEFVGGSYLSASQTPDEKLVLTTSEIFTIQEHPLGEYSFGFGVPNGPPTKYDAISKTYEWSDPSDYTVGAVISGIHSNGDRKSYYVKGEWTPLSPSFDDDIAQHLTEGTIRLLENTLDPKVKVFTATGTYSAGEVLYDDSDGNYYISRGDGSYANQTTAAANAGNAGQFLLIGSSLGTIASAPDHDASRAYSKDDLVILGDDQYIAKTTIAPESGLPGTNNDWLRLSIAIPKVDAWLLSFKATPDFEAPADTDADNAYIVEVTVGDGTVTAVQTLTVSVTDVFENVAPTDLALDNATIAENGAADAVVGSLTLSDVDGSGDPIIITEGVGEKIWEFEAGGAVQSSPAIGFDGTVYVGSNDKKLYAVNGQSGVKLWEFETGGAVESSPSIGSDGTVYVGSSDKKLYALNGQTGVKKWEFETGGVVPSSPSIGSDGTVYIGSDDYKLYALDGQTGAKKWEVETGEYGMFSSPSIGTDGTVYVASLDHGSGKTKQYAINGQTGFKLWEHQGDSVDVQSTPSIGSDGTVYVAPGGYEIVALNGHTGDKLWEFSNLFSRSSPSIGSDGTIYLGSLEGKVYALNGHTGTQKWEFETGTPGMFSSPANGSDGTVYVGSANNKLYAINGQTGAKKWEFETGGVVHSSPAIGSDGTVYVGSHDSKLYAIQGSSGPADSSWPMRGQNAQHTGRAKPQPTYALVAGAGDTDNAAFTIDGNELKLTAPADFETKETYSLRVEGTDTGGLTFAKALTITVTDDASDNPIDLTNGLVAYYPFNGNANDESGNGNDGTVNGATLSADRHGRAGKAYSFDGVDDYILASESNYTFPNQSITFWIKPMDLLNGQYIFDQQPFDNRAVVLGAQDNKLNLFDSQYPTGNALDTAVSISGIWQFVVCSIQGSSVFISLDGEIKINEIGQWTADNSSGIVFGTSIRNSGNVGYFNGSIDDVRIYDRALSAAEVSALYQLESELPAGSVTLDNATIAENGEADAVVGKLSLTVPDGTWNDPVIITEGVGEKLWEFETGDWIYSHPAIATDGTVYVTSFDNKLYALDGQSGAKQWEFVTGGKIHSSPAIGADGTVYVGSDDHKVYALNGQTGKYKWEFTIGGAVSSTPAIGEDGTVYVGAQDNKVYALDGQTGTKLWEFETGNVIWSTSAIGSNGTIYVGSDDNKVYALNGQTGAKQWEFVTGVSTYGVRSSPAIGGDGTVYVGSFDNKVYALDGQAGTKKWEFATGDVVHSTPAIGPDGTVYVGSHDNKLYALNGQSGVKLWEFATGGSVRSSPAIGSDGTVYVGSDDNKVYALNGAGGTILWEFVTGDAVWSSPSIGTDGTVYIGSYDNKLYAIQGSSGPADSPWPMRGQNAQHTGRKMPPPQPTYALVAGEGDTDNAAFTIDGDELKLNAPADFETKETYSLRVEGTDPGGLTFAKALTVTVTDVEEILTGEGESPPGLVADTTIDTDGDGLTNGEEENLYGTDPTMVDTDGDGFHDNVELELGTDPRDGADRPGGEGESPPGLQADTRDVEPEPEEILTGEGESPPGLVADTRDDPVPDYATISGVVTYEGPVTGPIYVLAIRRDRIVQYVKSGRGPGRYSMRVTNGKSYDIKAFRDGNGNGVLDAGWQVGEPYAHHGEWDAESSSHKLLHVNGGLEGVDIHISWHGDHDNDGFSDWVEYSAGSRGDDKDSTPGSDDDYNDVGEGESQRGIVANTRDSGKPKEKEEVDDPNLPDDGTDWESDELLIGEGESHPGIIADTRKSGTKPKPQPQPKPKPGDAAADGLHFILDGGTIDENAPAGTRVGRLVMKGDADTGLEEDTTTFELADGTGDDANEFFMIEGDELYLLEKLDPGERTLWPVRVSATLGDDTVMEESFNISIRTMFVPFVETLEYAGGIELGGGVIEDGGGRILSRGVILSDSPFFDSDKVLVLEAAKPGQGRWFQVGIGIGELIPGHTYYYQAFATNAEGTGYGFLLKFVAPRPSVATGPWVDAKPIGGSGWYQSAIGLVYLPGEQWAYHQHLGWVYVQGDSPGDLWLWMEGFGWNWTARRYYPYLYRDSLPGWVYLLKSMDGVPVFYNTVSGQLEYGSGP